MLKVDVTLVREWGWLLDILVLRMAEVLAPGTGSQMYDYLQSKICFRPIGFDPMLNAFFT